MRNVKDHWDDWAVKNVWHLVKNNEAIKEYLPCTEMANGRFPDKEFFWGIAFTILPVWSGMYYDAVLKKRMAQKKHKLSKVKMINISDHWKEKLLKHDFISKGKLEPFPPLLISPLIFHIASGKARKSILVQQTTRPYKRRDAKKKAQRIAMFCSTKKDEKMM